MLTRREELDQEIRDLVKQEPKKILDADTRKWSKKDIEEIKPHLKKYKYQVNFKMPGGIIRFAYTDDPVVTKAYMKSVGAKIVKVTKI